MGGTTNPFPVIKAGNSEVRYGANPRAVFVNLATLVKDPLPYSKQDSEVTLARSCN